MGYFGLVEEEIKNNNNKKDLAETEYGKKKKWKNSKIQTLGKTTNNDGDSNNYK